MGWFGGAAVGAALGLKPYPPPKLDPKAVEKARLDPEFNPEPNTPPSRLITAIVGDGTFLFGVPSSFYWMSARYKAPFLTIVLNNAGWNAPQRSAVLVHESGLSSKAITYDLNIEIARPRPDFVSSIPDASVESWKPGDRTNRSPQCTVRNRCGGGRWTRKGWKVLAVWRKGHQCYRVA